MTPVNLQCRSTRARHVRKKRTAESGNLAVRTEYCYMLTTRFMALGCRWIKRPLLSFRKNTGLILPLCDIHQSLHQCWKRKSTSRDIRPGLLIKAFFTTLSVFRQENYGDWLSLPPGTSTPGATSSNGLKSAVGVVDNFAQSTSSAPLFASR